MEMELQLAATIPTNEQRPDRDKGRAHKVSQRHVIPAGVGEHALFYLSILLLVFITLSYSDVRPHAQYTNAISPLAETTICGAG